jgi:hypothetical protein
MDLQQLGDGTLADGEELPDVAYRQATGGEALDLAGECRAVGRSVLCTPSVHVRGLSCLSGV